MFTKYDIHTRDVIWADPRYADQNEPKTRPLIVISQDIFHQNSNFTVCVGTTTNVEKDPYLIPINPKDQMDFQFKQKCQVMCKRLVSLKCNLIQKKMGKVTPEFLESIIGKLRQDILYSVDFTSDFSSRSDSTDIFRI
ncbi:MAG: hypothetical protein GWN01_16065 [Nitrosopumilaceae archaeon]|nr:type II toxin-antitoxin system PemK/MazF family toxin [Nitrosopumilaceae archaeon]NIU02353.1 type II toxin-antitoxin system PemK/MazF family toxin [Nitrosopumilaceae archaeon]NIU88810.1 hypothetical protein [Nitrosopumilaceae archaeon]NIV66935.1 hypothetical protein [Nitrosopumilaceae archaeon]NIX62954.1 hypothetical protein [Nitrosopumilaceae archaeon]